ncbi:MAG: Crp/Fnr family transcriptional regulator [Bryocella sp.]
MAQLKLQDFDAVEFLSNGGLGRKIIQVPAKQPFFVQGEPADAVFYIQEGRAKLSVVSEAGKEANVMLLASGDFIGEEAVEAVMGIRLASAYAISTCTVMKIERKEIMQVIHKEQEFSDLFVAFLLKRAMRVQADLVDHLFNSSEKRLARVLLLMANLDQPGESDTLIPQITQETLAEIVGTTRSRVSFFMNRFRSLGFIEYDGRIRVHKSLLTVVLHD